MIHTLHSAGVIHARVAGRRIVRCGCSRCLLCKLDARSDERVEYQTADSLSFQRFLDINLAQEALDYTAIRRFRERLGPERIDYPNLATT